MGWMLWMLARSIALNVAAVIAIGHGTAQLVLVALICAGFALKAALTLPHYDFSNTVLDVWYGCAAATICIVAASVGFQIDPERSDVGTLLPGSEYEKLVTVMVFIQRLSLAWPVVVMTYQLLMAFDTTKWLIPYSLRPLEPEEHAQLVQEFCLFVRAEGKFQRILRDLDSIEIWAFWHLMAGCKPTRGMMDLQSRMSPLARTGNSFISRRSSDRSSPSGEGSICEASVAGAAQRQKDINKAIENNVELMLLVKQQIDEYKQASADSAAQMQKEINHAIESNVELMMLVEHRINEYRQAKSKAEQHEVPVKDMVDAEGHVMFN